MNKYLLKFMLKLLVFVSPWLWLRNEKTDKDFDKWLYEAIISEKEIVLDTSSLDYKNLPFYAKVDGIRVWIKNSSYADATYKSDYWDHYASRATSLLFRMKYKKLIDEYKRFKKP